MKKIMLTLLAAFFVIVLAFSANAAIVETGTCGENLTWTLDDAGTLTISGYGEMEENSVYRFESPWDKSSFESVVITNGVTSIGAAAFGNCDNLKSIYVDSGNLYYCSENGVLFDKYKTKIVCYPSGNTATTYTIPGNVTSVGDSAFSGCDNLTSIVIPNSVTSIEDEAFSWCSGLTSIVIPNSVTSIGGGAFSGCYNLTSIVIPNSVTSIGDWAFTNCQELTSIVIPNSVTSIGDGAFYNCVKLTSIVIPNSVTSIGDSAFSGCSNLTTIVIPNSVTSIGDWAFWDCSKLQTICGTSGSYAEAFAKANGYTFTPVENPTFNTQMILTINDTNAVVTGNFVQNDVAPILENSRTMLPARFVAENLGAVVSWNDAEQKVTIKNATTTIEIVIGSTTAYVNGVAKTLDSPAFLRNSRTYTPVRFICESLGADVKWIDETQQVVITK